MAKDRHGISLPFHPLRDILTRIYCIFLLNTIGIKDCTYKYIRRNENDEVVEKLSAISPWGSMME